MKLKKRHILGIAAVGSLVAMGINSILKSLNKDKENEEEHYFVQDKILGENELKNCYKDFYENHSTKKDEYDEAHESSNDHSFVVSQTKIEKSIKEEVNEKLDENMKEIEDEMKEEIEEEMLEEKIEELKEKDNIR